MSVDPLFELLARLNTALYEPDELTRRDVDAVCAEMDALVREVRHLRTENRKLRHVLTWVEAQCPGKCSGVCDEALRVKPARAEGLGVRLATADELVEMGLLEFDEKEKP